MLGMGDVFDLDTGEIVRRDFSDHTGLVVSGGGEGGTVGLRDLRKGEAVHTLAPEDKAELARSRLGKHVSGVTCYI